MSQFSIMGVAHKITGYFSTQNRLIFEGVQELPSSKQGIRYHNFIVSFILRRFNKVVDIQDVDGKIYHVNRGSLSDWLRRNRDDLHNASKNGMLNISEEGIRDLLNKILEEKSPNVIVSIYKIKNDLEIKEEQKRRADKREAKSLYEEELPNEIANLKTQLAEAYAERSRLSRENSN